jgi:hypothetical protein
MGGKLCTAGVFGPCTGAVGPSPEICNGLDDNCDGKVDEGVGHLCTDYSTCTTYTSCVACPQAPTETCDGKDNDCNGKIDDAIAGLGIVCGTNIGECQQGVTDCVGGKIVCIGEIGPTAEICDGKDNNCDGKIDEAVIGEGQPCGSDVGECQKGKTKCVGGKYICVGEVGPSEEICDGKDNNCDGKADETAECPGKSACIEGRCLLPCGSAEFICPGGSTCINGYCVPDDCAGVKCKDDERCVNGLCVPKCTGSDCPPHQKCDLTTGQCLDDSCISKGCPAGQICAGYTCVQDPCPPGTCPPYQGCANGTCFDVCLNVSCPPGQTCVRGACTDDPCAAKSCPSTHTCKVVEGKGQCEPDPCRIISCELGEVCREGKCTEDPCNKTKCPSGMDCTLSYTGLPDCIVVDPSKVGKTTEVLAAGGGGLACAIDRGGAPSARGWSNLILPLFLCALCLGWRKRRSSSR